MFFVVVLRKHWHCVVSNHLLCECHLLCKKVHLKWMIEIEVGGEWSGLGFGVVLHLIFCRWFQAMEHHIHQWRPLASPVGQLMSPSWGAALLGWFLARVAQVFPEVVGTCALCNQPPTTIGLACDKAHIEIGCRIRQPRNEGGVTNIV